jgi:hypothetical protein
LATRSLRWLVGALLVALPLAACSSGDEPSSDTASSPTESSPTSGSETPTTGDVCAELSAVKSAAVTIRSDLQARQLAGAATDISTLQSAIDDLLQAMSSSAQGDVDDVTSAWSDVKSTVANLDKSNLDQARTMLQDSVGELRTALENVGSDLSCS